MIRIRSWFEAHRSFILLLLLFVSFRLLVLFLLHPGGFITNYSEFDFYYAWGQLLPLGHQPFVDLWSAYPPLISALVLPIFEAASRIPPWVEPRLFFVTLFGLELLLFEIGNLILIYRLAQRLPSQNHGLPPSTSLTLTHPAVLYALLFAPLQSMLGFIDCIPLFFLLLGIDLLTNPRRGLWLLSPVAIALGFLSKLTPIILVPIALQWLLSQSQAKKIQKSDPSLSSTPSRTSLQSLLYPLLYCLLTFAAIVAVGYPLVHGNLELGLSSLRIQSIRPPWQSIWALIDGYYGFGLVPIDMRNLQGLRTYQWRSAIPWSVVTIGFGLVYGWLYTRRFAWQQLRTVLGFTGVSLIGLLLYSKGWSPQFLVWVVAFVVLLLPTLRGISIVILLTLLNFVESFVYLILLPEQRWLLWATVIGRTLLLLILAVDFLCEIWPQEKFAHLLASLNRRVTWGVFTSFVIVSIIGWPKMVESYWQGRLTNHPCPGVVETLQAEAGWPNRTIVTNRVENWQQLYPWLRTQYNFVVVDRYGIADSQPAGVVDDEVRKVTMEKIPDGEFWYVGRGPEDVFLIDLPNQIGTDTATYDLVDLENREVAPWNGESQWSRCVVMRLFKYSSPANTRTVQPEKPYGLLNGTIRLLNVAQSEAKLGGDFRFVLYWQKWLPIEASYTVFTQLLDGSGKVVAQQDNLPVNGLAPTNTWNSPVIRDPYVLHLPSELQPGTYQLYVGMYDAALNRLPVQLPDGSTADHIAVPVEVH